jgi:hypothetical protein
VGLASGYLLARLGAARLSWALAIGGMAGTLGGLAVLGVHRQIIPRRPNGEIDQASLDDPDSPSGAEDL